MASHLGVTLKEGIDLTELVNEGCTWTVNFNDLAEAEPEKSYLGSDIEVLESLRNTELYDDDCFTPGSGFDTLDNLIDIYDNGKIKKRIIRDGYGNTPPEKSLCTIQYNAYLEYADEPFDSTYVRRDPFKFHLDQGAVVPGLEIAVKTMKINEKAQFLVHYDYAYGKMGCLERIPPKSMILYEIEFKETLNVGATLSYDNLEEESKKEFVNAYEYALQLCTKANDLFKKNLYKKAIKEYNMAIGSLEFAILKDYHDQEKQQKLLLRLYTNKVVTHVKLKEPKQACHAANRIYSMVKGTSMKVPAKVFYNNGKALIMLNDLVMAETRLKTAHRLKPLDESIAHELAHLEELRKKARDSELKFSKGFMTAISSQDGSETSKSNNAPVETGISEEFKSVFADVCTSMLEDDEQGEYVLPKGLNAGEMCFIKEEIKKHGLGVKQASNGTEDIVIYKIKNDSQ